MKKKNGFTLIELLAIIVILAIIAVITVPIILNIIETSKQGAAKDSAYGYKDSISNWYISKLSNNQNFKLDGTYTVADGKLNNEEIPISGDKPSSGYMTYKNNVLTKGCLVIDDYAVTFNNGDVLKAEKGNCSSSEIYYSFDTTDCDEFPCNTEESDEIDETWTVYVKENTQTNIKEVCGVFENGTVCLESNKWEGTYNDPLTPYGGEYIQNKKVEFEGAIGNGYTCEIENTHLDCQSDIVACYVDYDGYVYCGDNIISYRCFIDLNNQTGCNWW